MTTFRSSIAPNGTMTEEQIAADIKFSAEIEAMPVTIPNTVGIRGQLVRLPGTGLIVMVSEHNWLDERRNFAWHCYMLTESLNDTTYAGNGERLSVPEAEIRRGEILNITIVNTDETV